MLNNRMIFSILRENRYHENGLEVGGSAIIRIYDYGNYLKYHYVDICDPDIAYEIAEIVMSTIDFIWDHGEKKSYTGETRSAEL